jgi:opacity protein-like surface antigen
MMKKILFAAATFMASTALAGDYYARVEGTYALSHKSSKAESEMRSSLVNAGNSVTKKAKQHVAGGSLAFGMYAPSNMRAELAFLFSAPSRADFTATKGKVVTVTKTKIKSMATLINAYYDIADLNGAVPYVSLGLGMGSNKYEIDNTKTKTSKSKSGIAYQAGLGANYHLTDSAALGLGYRFVHFGKVATADPATQKGKKMNVTAHQLHAGVTFSF